MDNVRERNAHALEIAGRIVSEMVGNVRPEMFSPTVDPTVREKRRTEGAEEIGDLVKKLAEKIVTFI